MSENFVSKDFLSKENITILYKQITLTNEFNNLTKQQKDFIVNQLIDTMKRTYKTLDLTKINTNNIINVKKQFNSIVVKQTTDLVKNSISKIDNNQNQHQRSNERNFESVKRNIPNPTGIDRPASSTSGQLIIQPQQKVSDDFIKKTQGDIASRLSELENSRRTNDSNKPNDIPDFLKPVRVGKTDMMNIPSITPNRTLEGIGLSDNNFKNDNLVIDASKYNDNMSIQDRLKKLESERGMPVSNQQISNNGNVNSMFSQQSNISDMFSNTIPSSQPSQQYNQQPPPSQMQYNPLPPPQAPPSQMQYNPAPPPQAPPSQMQYNPLPPPQAPPSQMQYNPAPPQQSPPSQMQYNPAPPQPPPSQMQYNPLPPQGPPAQMQYNNQQAPSQSMSINPDILQQLNEMQKFIQILKQENENLKSHVKNKPLSKTLQIDINKKEANYNFQFNPINNITSIKLLSYNLPQPVYNIYENCNFIYKINDMDHTIQIPKGNYNIETLLNYLNKNNDLIFSIDFTQKVSVKSKDNNVMFQIMPTFIAYKLGFNNSSLNSDIIADRLFDLRMPSKLLLFIKNINTNEPVFILNFNNTSICNLQFKNPLNLSSLELEFYTEDNILYNFNDLFYNLSFAIDVLE